MEPVFKCPACHGSIAFWVVRKEFSCHHCGMVLQSNLSDALAKSLWVALIVETVFFLAIFLMIGNISRTFIVWGAGSAFLGYLGGWLALKHFVRLVPVQNSTNPPLTLRSSGTAQKRAAP